MFVSLYWTVNNTKANVTGKKINNIHKIHLKIPRNGNSFKDRHLSLNNLDCMIWTSWGKPSWAQSVPYVPSSSSHSSLTWDERTVLLRCQSTEKKRIWLLFYSPSFSPLVFTIWNACTTPCFLCIFMFRVEL